MLALAAEQSLGTQVAVVVDPDPESARAKARGYAALYLGLTHYTNNLLRFGFTEADPTSQARKPTLAATG